MELLGRNAGGVNKRIRRGELNVKHDLGRGELILKNTWEVSEHNGGLPGRRGVARLEVKKRLIKKLGD